MTEHVLAVAGAVLQASQRGQEPLVEIGDADVGQRVARRSQAQLLDFDLALLVGLFDAVRVDAPVQDQPLESEPTDLATHRVEAGQQDGLRRVVDDQVDAGDGLVGADVAALAPDDAALHLVVGQVQDRHDRLGGLLAGHALHGFGDDLAGLGGALRAGVVLDRAHEQGGLAPRPGLDPRHQLGLGLLGREAGHALELSVVLVDARTQLGGPGVE